MKVILILTDYRVRVDISENEGSYTDRFYFSTDEQPRELNDQGNCKNKRVFEKSKTQLRTQSIRSI